MLRYGILELAVLAIPFAIYFAYRNFLLRHKLEEGAEYSPVPYHRLFVIGGVLAVLAFVVMYLAGDKVQNGKYVPAHMENGQLVPGKVVVDKTAEPENRQENND